MQSSQDKKSLNSRTNPLYRHEIRSTRVTSRMTSKTPCKFYLKGRCKYGKSCKFSHNIKIITKIPIICKFYINGKCEEQSCRFIHPKNPILYSGDEVYFDSTEKEYLQSRFGINFEEYQVVGGYLGRFRRTFEFDRKDYEVAHFLCRSKNKIGNNVATNSSTVNDHKLSRSVFPELIWIPQVEASVDYTRLCPLVQERKDARVELVNLGIPPVIASIIVSYFEFAFWDFWALGN